MSRVYLLSSSAALSAATMCFGCLQFFVHGTALAQPSVYGQWHGIFPVGVQAIHAALTHTGYQASPYVVMWDYAPPANVKAWKLNDTAWLQPGGVPAVISFQPPGDHVEWKAQDDVVCGGNNDPNTITMLFCSGHTFLPNGDLFTAGGGVLNDFDCPQQRSQVHGASYRLPVANIAPGANPWLREKPMPHGYYYPTVRLDNDGTALAFAGSDCTDCEPMVQQHVFKLDVPNQDWLAIGQPSIMPLPATYPFVNVLTWPSYTNGELSIIDRSANTHKRLTNCGGGYQNCAWQDFVPWSGAPDLSTACAAPLMYHAPGISALSHNYPNGSVMLFGSTSNSTNKIVRLWKAPGQSPTDPDPLGKWLSSQDVPPAFSPSLRVRNKADCVYLPSGKMFLVGGGIERQPSQCTTGSPPCPDLPCPLSGEMTLAGIDCAVLEAELYDPNTGVSQLMAAEKRPRLYHSTALLLPDGRVFVGGGEYDSCLSNPPANCSRIPANDPNFEVFSPPYIFANPSDRLQITSAPAEFRYGFMASFSIQGQVSGSELKVLLIKPGSVTHSTNFDQRVVRLRVDCTNQIGGDPNARCVRVEIPAKSTNLLPPGYYMLWVTKNDIPCVQAKFVKVTDGAYGTATCECTAGCPVVYAWDGSDYARDNNVLNGSGGNLECAGEYVTDYYRLRQPLEPQGLRYSLRIEEERSEWDFFDSVSLITIDHAPDVDVALSARGEVIAYKGVTPPLSAVDHGGGDQLVVIQGEDGLFFDGYPGDYLVLNFGPSDQVQGDFIAVADKKPIPEESILVQVPDAKGWKTVDVIGPREAWAEQVGAREVFGPPLQGDLVVRLYWTRDHKLEQVGFVVPYASKVYSNMYPPLRAAHSVHGDVLAHLLLADSVYARVIPTEKISLDFPYVAPPAKGLERDVV